jgi:hypothetical protein
VSIRTSPVVCASDGFHVSTPQQARLLQASDEAQLVFAAHQDSLILTYNRKHFSPLHQQYERDGRLHGGILVVSSRPIDQLEIRVAMALDWIAALPNYRSQFFRWHEIQQRLIHGERISGYSEDEVRRALGHPA